MRRTLIVLSIILAALAFLVGVGWGALFHTPAGRAFLARQIEPRLGEAFASTADIGGLEGALPSHFVLRDIELKDANGTWLRATRVEVLWSPLALFNSELQIARIEAEDIALLRSPPERAPEENEELKAFSLPDGLPRVSIDAFELRNLSVSGDLLAGESARLDGSGSLSMGGRALNVTATLASSNNADSISALVAIDPGAASLITDVTVSSDKTGLLATLANLGGPLSLRIKGAGPPEAFKVDANGELGGYGVLEAELVGDLANAGSLSANGAFVFGDKLSSLSAELGPMIEFATTLALADDGGALSLDSISTDALSLSGDLGWRTREGAIAEASTDLEAVLSDAFHPDIAAYLGQAINLNATLARRGVDYLINADLRSPMLQVTVSDTISDLQRAAAGRLSATVNENAALPPPLQSGGTFTGAFTLEDRTQLAVSDLEIAASESIRLSGSADIDFDAQTFAAAADATVSASAIAQYAPDIDAEGEIKGDVEASGAFDDFAVSIDAVVSPSRINGTTLQAGYMKGSFSGLPAKPTGSLAARDARGVGRLNLTISANDAGVIEIPSLTAKGAKFSLQASASFDADAQRLVMDADYKGADGAEPWPGFPLSGDLTVKGRLGRASESNALSVYAGRLSANAFALTNMRLDAVGPAENITLNASADAIDLAAGAATEIKLAGVLDIADDLKLTLQSFAARVEGVRTNLTQPAMFDFENGLKVDALRATLGRNGSLALDGAFTNSRWRLTTTAVGAPIRSAASNASFTLDLDTDRAILATGDFQLTSRLTDAQEAAIAGRLTWDGKRLVIENASASDAMKFDLDLPARLGRNPLSVETDGSLAGTASYTGRVEAIAVYLPLSLQSVEGELSGSAALGGTVAAPAIEGQLALVDGRYTDFTTGLALAGIRVDATATPDEGGSKIVVDAGARGLKQSAESITATGTISVRETVMVDAALKLADASLAAGPISRLVASGDARLTGPIDALQVEGDIAINQLDVEIVTPQTSGLVAIDVRRIGPNGETAKEQAARSQSDAIVAFNVALNANDRIFIRGRGLDSEWRATLSASGNTQDPLILGSMVLRRGFLDFSGRRFTLTRGEIIFDRLTPNDPTLDIRAEYETGEGVVAAIVIKGRATAPAVSLESTPSLPSEDIMALVLFGKPATELSAIESVQMAQALANLGGIGFGGGIGARQALGLDMLNVDFDSETGAGSVAVGKYVADGLFVSATQDARGESGSVRVQYEISNSITVETEIQQDGDQTVSANWKHDF